MKYLLKIKYLGTRFSGFQYQPNARTVQGELTAACKRVFGCDCKVTGCSRTDSGVHANAFCATVEPISTIPSISLENIPKAFSAILPDDISVFYADIVDDDFHPRYRPHSKEYIYLIHNSAVKDPFLVGRAWRMPYKITDAGFYEMQRAARLFVGRQDFASFMAEGSKITDTVREIFYCEASREADVITVRVSADGFLYNMVRIIVGTLVDVALGRKTADAIPKIIEAKNRALSGPTAPPEGLYLNKVTY